MPHSDGPPIRLAVVDADRRVRRDLADLLGLLRDLTVVATTGSPSEAIELVGATGAEVVLVDPELPDEPVGLALVAALRARWPALRIVVMSVSPEVRGPALAAGANVFLNKECPVGPFVDDIAKAASSCERVRGAGPSNGSPLDPRALPDSVAAPAVGAPSGAAGRHEDVADG